jgi:uncharacterized protein YcbX
MQVSSLHHYPIKGCRGHDVEQLTFDRFGVVGDRRLMLVDANGRFVSQREAPALATLDPVLDDSVLTVVQDGRTPFTMALDPDGPPIAVTVWGKLITAHDQGDGAAAWFSGVLGRPLRLVRWGKSSHRPIDPTWAPSATVETTFNDGYPALGVTEASLDDLNRRLADPVPMARFRPTLVVRGAEAWGEDAWREVRVGNFTFDAVKPCDRCVVTTTDQRSGAKHPEQEPLRTLVTFRTMRGLGVIFGQNLVHRGPGSIRVGDQVVA